MATKHDLQGWIIEILRDAGREMSVLEVSREVWQRYEPQLRASGSLFYTWQYDLRWAAQELRNNGKLTPKRGQRAGGWALAHDAPVNR